MIQKMKKVLVIGDWLVDENWIIGQHRNKTSSRIGENYSRALNTADSSMKALCGAGLVASILQEKINGQPAADVYGLGLWHPRDTSALEQMLDPTFNTKTHHCLVGKENTVQPNANPKLFCLNTEDDGDFNFKIGTTRVIRIYELSRGKPKLKQRIDWDIQVDQTTPSSHDYWHLLLKLPGDIDFVIAKDLGKGVISSDLVRQIKERYPKAKWYVSSKIWKPVWLREIKPNLKLYLIPQVAARLGLNDPAAKIECWLTRDGVPSKDALDYLTRTHKETRVVVIPDDATSRVLAYDGNDSGYVQPNKLISDELGLTQMASVFLPAIVAFELNTSTSTRNNFKENLKNALAYTDRWRMMEQRRIVEYNWKAKRLPFDQKANNEGAEVSKAQWCSFNWEGMKNIWERAFQDNGVIDNEFHLWRGMTELNNYVSCVPEKRKHIQDLLRDGRRFKDRPSSERKHVSYLIMDHPGSGKTYLIDRLAESLGMNVLKFNLTQVSSHDDLLKCFDKIRSKQEENRGSPVMVFFDEINHSPNNNTFLYGRFLESMYDGYYTLAGVTHRLEPCFWIFAGTELPPNDAPASIKWRDFESRLSRKPMNLGGANRDNEIFRVEKIYMGVAAIRSEFPDVTEISEEVLWLFRSLKDETGPRDITRLVRNCENVQYGTVGLAQFHDNEITHHLHPSQSHDLKERRKKREVYVKIVDEPGHWWDTRDGAAA